MGTKPQIAHEHEFEPQYGLPEPLPAGEVLLWQGTPDWRVLARRVFHVNKVAAYFTLMLAWRFASVLADSQDLLAALKSLTWLVPLFALGLGMLFALARWTAATTVYTLTDRRIVMRIGIVLTVAYNLPLKCIEGADLRDAGHGCGDIALSLERGTRIAWLHLWPHARPWQVARPQPMLRALPDAAAVSALLATAWSAANGAPATTRSDVNPAAPSPACGRRGLRPALAAHSG
jgi:hypothetical protein